MKLYKQALKRGWDLTTKHKWLWFFGVFILLFNGHGGEYDLYFRDINRLFGKESIINLAFWQERIKIILENLNSLWTNSKIGVIFLILILLIALSFLIYFIIISQIALIYATKQKEEDLTFNKCFWAGHKHFWNVLAINFITKTTIILTLAIIAIPIIKITSLEQGSSANYIYFFISIFISVPVILTISFVNKYAINYTVSENEKMLPALKKSWQIFFKNWLVSLEMAFIIFVLSLLIGLFIIIATGIMIAPFLASSISNAYTTSSLATVYTIFIVALFIFIVGSVLAAAIFSTWQWTSWSYLFQELTKGKKEGKLLRVFDKK